MDVGAALAATVGAVAAFGVVAYLLDRRDLRAIALQVVARSRYVRTGRHAAR